MKGKRAILAIISIVLLITMSVSIAGSLPVVNLPPTTYYVKMYVTDGSSSWFDVEIKNSPAGCDITNGTYRGWCAQKNIEMTRGVNHSVVLYSSYDPNMPTDYNGKVNWSKINYILNIYRKYGASQDSIQKAIWYYIHLDGNTSDPVAQALINDAEQNCSNFVPEEGEILAIIADGIGSIQRSFLEYVIKTSDSPGVNVGIVNNAPTADGTAGEPYGGFAYAEITFDGSRSYDRDGRIISWRWNFGDGTNGTGEVAKHIYYYPGNYTVILKVTDNKFATDYYTTTAVITLGDNPPKTPTIIGAPKTGHKNTSYTFNVLSTDLDNDSIQYTFNWGDGSGIIKTIYYPSGAITTQSHAWSTPGRYIITVSAFDSNISSENATLAILIDALDVKDIGYLIDIDGDGTYDVFHSNSTGIETNVKKLDNGNYLIDTDADGLWNMIYDPASNQLQVYHEEPVFAYAILVILVISFALIFYLISKRKRSNKH